MAREAILRITQAETAAEETQERAKAYAEHIVKQAHLTAEEAVAKAELNGKALIKKQLEKAAEDKKEIDKAAADEAERLTEALTKSASNNYEKAVDMVIDIVLG